MTIAPLSLPPFSHFHPSTSPLAIPLLPYNDLSTRKSNLILSMPQFSRMSPHRHHLTGFIHERPSRCRKWRRSRIAPRRGHGSGFRFSYEPLAGFESKSPIFRHAAFAQSAFLVLQPPTAAVYFPSQPLSKCRARQQKCTRLFHIYELNLNLSHLNSSLPFRSPFGHAEPITQALAPVTEFGRSSARMKRCVKFVHSHNFVNRIRKGYVCPSVANATARPGAKLYSISSLLRAASFHFSVVLYKYIRVLTSSLSPNILGPLCSCCVSRHCSSFACP